MPYAGPDGYNAMPILDTEQLTGRTRTHVLEFSESGFTLQPSAARAFLALRAAAARDGLDLAPASSFRDFERQLAIWNDKFLGRRALLDRDGTALDPAAMSEAEIVHAILQWSALPGASRHHWGTEIDVYDRHALRSGQRMKLVPAEFAPAGVFAPLERWLAAHAEDYGFFRPYDQDRGGVQPEPWHLSFAPLSGPALQALTPEVLAQALNGADLAGAAVVRSQLEQIHARYVSAVASPSPRSLRAPALPIETSPAATPS
jgi:LAS superfamily LD-carboxypeptidase LdcB